MWWVSECIESVQIVVDLLKAATVPVPDIVGQCLAGLQLVWPVIVAIVGG